jgi:hypothetical protein
VQINENHWSLCHFAKEVYAESLQEKAAAPSVSEAQIELNPLG